VLCFRRYDAHLASGEHKRVNEDAYAAAEETSTRTCERCGSPGCLHEDHGWLATLCTSCAAGSGFLLLENP